MSARIASTVVRTRASNSLATAVVMPSFNCLIIEIILPYLSLKNSILEAVFSNLL
jgi:hypothetical protein